MVAQHHVARLHQVIESTGADQVAVIVALILHPGRQLAPLPGVVQQLPTQCHRHMVLLAELLDLAEQVFQLAAFIGQDLAVEQVDALDGVGTFVDGSNPHIPGNLLHARLADKTVTAEHLYAQLRRFHSRLGENALGDRREQGQAAHGRVTYAAARAVVMQVHQLCACQVDHTPAFGEGLLRQQHAPHIRVGDDRVGGLLGLERRHRAHLHALAGIAQGALERGFGVALALLRHRQAGFVDKGKHGIQAAVGRAQQVTGSTVEVDHAGGVAMNTHLVFDRATAHAVGRTGATVVIDQALGHREQGNTLDPGRCAFDARQHQVQDVVGDVVLAGGNEHLAAGDSIAALCLRLGAGAQQAQVRAAVGFGQAHGAGHAAFDQRWQKTLLECVIAVGIQGADGTRGEVKVHVPGVVGAEQQVVDHTAHRRGQPLAAVRLGLFQGEPAVVGELPEGSGKARRCADLAVLPGATLDVAHSVQGRDFLLGKLGGLFDDGIEHCRVDGFTAVELLVVGGEVVEFMDDELQVAQRGLVAGHVDVLRVTGTDSVPAYYCTLST
ncbi:hypothetical protein D3C80_662970 [compost metagenome]